MSTFRLVQKIGQGSYSKVYKAINDTSLKNLAVKVISLKNVPRKYILSRQIKILRECKHPNIAPLVDYFVTQDSMYLVFQFFQMNLSQYYRYYRNIYNKNLDQNSIKNIMIQICSGLSYLHSKGIMHRDIKPQNVMVNPLTQQIKLIDFGFAKDIGTDKNTGYMVTRWYRPLEVVLGLNYNQKIDVFAAGAVFLQLLQGQEIFQSSSNMDQMYMLLNICGYPDPQSKEHQALSSIGITNTYRNPSLQSYLRNASDSTKQILTSVLSNNPDNRPSINRFLQILVQTPQRSRVGPIASRDSITQPRKRTCSSTNGITIVSIAFSSRSRSNSKDEREIFPKRHQKLYPSKQPNQPLYRIVE